MKKPKKEYDFKKVQSLGAEICIRIHSLYFSNIHWSVCYRKVAELFNQLKLQARNRSFDKGLDDVEFLTFLLTCTNEDYKDLIDAP